MTFKGSVFSVSVACIAEAITALASIIAIFFCKCSSTREPLYRIQSNEWHESYESPVVQEDRQENKTMVRIRSGGRPNLSPGPGKRLRIRS